MSIVEMQQAVGRAVLMAQVFESIFLVSIELVLSIRKFHLDGTPSEPLTDSKFKIPTKSLLRELSSNNDIDPDFEREISELIEKRHILIHRWYINNGLPLDDGADGIDKLTEHANDVYISCYKITLLLVEYINKWIANKEAYGDDRKLQLHLAEQLFHKAHKISSQI